MEIDDILSEVADFKRHLASIVDHPQVQKPSPATASRFTELPSHALPSFAFTEEEDEYRYPGLPGPFCPDSATLDITLSGITGCSCAASGLVFSTVTLSGIAGVFTVTGGSGSWTLNGVGSWSKSDYSDAACATLITTTTGAYNISVSCSNGTFFVSIVADDTSHSVFNGTGKIDVTIGNDNVCSGTQLGIYGTATVALPP